MSFDTKGIEFAEQYFHVYNARLNKARDSLIKNSHYRWGNHVKNIPLEELSASLENTEVFIIGTLFKVMPKQPSILKDENRLIAFDANENFTSDEDTLVLHEIDENVTVVGDIKPHEHVTGIPISLLGRQLEDGAKFHVIDICYAGPSLSVYKMPPSSTASQEKIASCADRLLIVSGFEFGFDAHLSAEKTSLLVAALKKLLRFVSGVATGDEMNGHTQNKITKIIVAGNSIAPGYTKAKAELAGIEQAKSSKSLVEIIKMFDEYLYNLAQSGSTIDLMPGRNDPTTFLLPQQPFHPKILPLSGMLQNVRPVTNPCAFKYEDCDVELLGMSGETVDAIRQNTKIEHATTILKSLIEWGHIAPNAPDNLSCIPYKENDPFVLDKTYDIYFAGNQPEYLASTYYTDEKSKIQLISVPSFVKTQSCVLINLKNLESELVSF